MSSVLALDLGKTSCRAAVWSADAGASAETVTTATGPGSHGLAESGGVQGALDAVEAVAELLDRPVEPIGVGVGAAGVSAAPQATREFAFGLREFWPRAEIVVASDAVTSHAGALLGGPGVVLAAGTGAVALGVDAAGAVCQVDGWGPWLGDDGGGAWLGRAGLHAVLAALDGRGPATTLTSAATDAYGADLHLLPAVIGGDPAPVRAMAAFAPRVADAAGTGDAVAMDLIARAATALADAVLAAARRTGGVPVPVALTGGLLELGDVLVGPLTAQLRAAADEVTLVAAAGGSLDGARILAEHSDTVHEARLVRLAPRCAA